MIHYKNVTKIIQEIASVKCDVCGREYDAGNLETQEFHHIRFRGGYTSIFGDDVEVECDICQHCLYKMIDGFCRRKGDGIEEVTK